MTETRERKEKGQQNIIVLIAFFLQTVSYTFKEALEKIALWFFLFKVFMNIFKFWYSSCRLIYCYKKATGF